VRYPTFDCAFRSECELVPGHREHSQGVILECGRFGSGKPTPLHSLLHDINRPDMKIWTADDAIVIAISEISESLDEICAETDLDRALVLAQWRMDFSSNSVLLLY